MVKNHQPTEYQIKFFQRIPEKKKLIRPQVTTILTIFKSANQRARWRHVTLFWPTLFQSRADSWFNVY